MVVLSDFGLFFKLVQVGVEFTQDVFDTREVLTGVGESVFGFASTLFVFGDACSLFQEKAQFFRLGFDDATDRALTDDGIGPRAQACAQEHVLDIAPAHRLVVDEITAGAIAGQHALDRNLRVLAPLSPGPVVIVVKDQFHTGAAGSLSGGGAVEDDVLHGLATQFAGPTLAQHPTHRIHDVGFAAAVGTDHPHQLTGKHEIGRFCERFETGQFDRTETHRGSLFEYQSIVFLAMRRHTSTQVQSELYL